MSLVKVDVLYVVPHWVVGQPAVVLKDPEGGRILPIFIGEREAMAIEMAIEGVKPERPLTHDLFAETLKRLKVKLKRVVITDLKNDIFYARLELKTKRGILKVDSRPSDAIALALRLKAPIYVDEKVFVKYSVEKSRGVKPPGSRL